MDFQKYFETAWHLTIQFIVPLIIMTLVMMVVGVLTLGILAPVMMAGYIQSILMLLREKREPKVQDLFSQMKLFLPLLLFGVVIFLGVMIGMMLLILPGILLILAVLFSCFYMIPLMTDQNLGLMDSVKKSYAMAMEGKRLDHIIAVIIFFVIVSIGGSVFIGTLLTQPFATLFFVSVYEEKNRQHPA